MGWVKRLADHVIQDRFFCHDLEFAWVDLRPEDPDQQSKILDLYVRSGIYAINEARQVLGLAPVPGGDTPMVYGTSGPVPLGQSLSPSPALREREGPAAKRWEGEGFSRTAPTVAKAFNPDEPRVPAGSPDGGQWTSDGGGSDEAANSRRDRMNRCIEQCLYLLERPLPYRWSNLNEFAFRRCVNECMQADG